LPETVGGAGLTFRPDEAENLARQVRRVIEEEKGERRKEEGVRGGNGRPELPGREEDNAGEGNSRLRVAVVAFRFGKDFAGGAETSLRRMAECLHHAGHHVEIFTTCTRAESDWSNQLPEGTAMVGGRAVHRYRLDPHDRQSHLEAVRAVLEVEGPVAAGVEESYLRHSLHSTRLLEALGQRVEEFDAILTGPYLFGLTLDVARAFPDRTLVVGCFHDEPVARLGAWQEYLHTAGILYHSEEEKLFAETRLGLNHPRGVCVGAVVDPALAVEAATARGLGCRGKRYIVYCGRYSAQKDVPLLVAYAERYAAEHPERFSFVFLGQGEVAIPKHPSFRDLGFVDEQARNSIIRGAAALVQLSRHESLSYAALEAWSQHVPVIAAKQCAVLAGHVRRSDGGQVVGSFEDFALALDDLWQDPDGWRARGVRGQEYVQKHYGSR